MEGQCSVAPGSPDRSAACTTLKVHLPNGTFNVVKYGEAIDIKVRTRGGYSRGISIP